MALQVSQSRFASYCLYFKAFVPPELPIVSRLLPFVTQGADIEFIYMGCWRSHNESHPCVRDGGAFREACGACRAVAGLYARMA